MVLRLGAFQRILSEWAEKPCLLTVSVASSGGEIRLAGILRPYFSLSSVHGWALVPPQQHGGFAAIRLTELRIEKAGHREVVLDPGGPRLRFGDGGEVVFTLQRDDARLTGPPRATRSGRYLYVGGRRRPSPEPWMLR
ncbi:MAG TPA: hypothetical protein VHS26_00430 [Solirubrobacteraceae bacterium]|nr:hypothetical protein [Solirubrobacteraceae bacterium]